MGYPLEYDNLENLDLNECVSYSHSLTDGILGDFYKVPLGDLLRVFARYSASTTPLLSLVKYDQTYLEKDIPGIEFNGTGTYYFDIVIGDLGEKTPDDYVWQDGFYVLKLHSANSDIVYSKPIKLIRTEDACATRQDLTEVSEQITEQSNEIQSDIDYVPSQRSGASIKM